MDHLPRAFLPELHGRIRFGAKMVAIEQDGAGVTVHYQTASGRGAVTGEHAIISVPFPGSSFNRAAEEFDPDLVVVDVTYLDEIVVRPLITHRFSLDDIGEAYRIFSNRLDGVLKVAITP